MAPGPFQPHAVLFVDVQDLVCDGEKKKRIQVESKVTYSI